MSSPTTSAITRSSRWNSPSVSATFAASASARTWLTATDTTSVINARTAAVVCPSAASRQNRHENTTMSAIRSRTESMNAPERPDSPRWRATEPSITSNVPPKISATAAQTQSPVTIKIPETTLAASASKVSWFGLTPVHRRKARTPR